MAKRLAGKRWFEAQGRRAFGRRVALPVTRPRHESWPTWASHAYTIGYYKQASVRQHKEGSEIAA